MPVPVQQLADIPPAERGIVEGLARALGAGRVRPSTMLKNPNRVLGQVDGYVATDRVLVNGVELNPAPGASIVVYTQVNKIVSSDAAMTVGGIALDAPQRLQPRHDGRRTATRSRSATSRALPGPIADLGGFPMDGELDVTLLPGTRARRRGSQITTELKLPSF